MQNSVFKAEVKAKVIALPAQEWIKSEIPTLTSLALQDSSQRMNLLAVFYIVYLFAFISLFPALPIWVCRAHRISHGPDWVFTATEQQEKQQEITIFVFILFSKLRN